MTGQRATGWEGRQRQRLTYTPVMQFYLRMIRMALFEALRVEGMECPYGLRLREDWPKGKCSSTPGWESWDAAIMARHWIARPAPSPRQDLEGYLLSFDAACAALELEPDHERLWMLEKIDAAADFDTDQVWERVEHLSANPPEEYEEPLFDAPRVVPALDQGNFFAMLEAA